MIVQGLIAAPVRWLGGNPILAFNVAMFTGYVLTAFAFGLLARRWTGSWAAAFVAASAAGFNAHLFTRMAHLQAMHVEFVALVLYGLDQVFTRGRIRDAITLGVGFALQALTSIYLMVFTTWALIFGGLTRLVLAGRGKRGRPVLLAVLAGGVALLLLAFYLNAYYQVHVQQGFARVRRRITVCRLVCRLPEHGLLGPLPALEPSILPRKRRDELPRHRRPAAGGCRGVVEVELAGIRAC